jgi:hypothetical protein
MTGWDIVVYIAAAVLIIGPIIVFSFYLKEIFRHIREDDFGQKN